jgi:hypothetical protein
MVSALGAGYSRFLTSFGNGVRKGCFCGWFWCVFSVGGAHRYDSAPLWGWCIKLLSGYYVFYAGQKPATVHAVGTT